MKFISSPFAYWGAIGINIVFLIAALILGLYANSILHGLEIYMYVGPVLILCIPLASQKVKIDKTGIKECCCFITLKKVRWDELCGIRIHYKNNVSILYKFVFFLLEPIELPSISQPSNRECKSIIQVAYSDKLIQCIKSYTNIEIMDC